MEPARPDSTVGGDLESELTRLRDALTSRELYDGYRDSASLRARRIVELVRDSERLHAEARRHDAARRAAVADVNELTRVLAAERRRFRAELSASKEKYDRLRRRRAVRLALAAARVAGSTSRRAAKVLSGPTGRTPTDAGAS